MRASRRSIGNPLPTGGTQDPARRRCVASTAVRNDAASVRGPSVVGTHTTSTPATSGTAGSSCVSETTAGTSSPRSGPVAPASFSFCGEGANSPSWSDRRERSREGIQRPHGSQTRSPLRLLPLRSREVVRCSPRLRRRSNVVRNGEAVSSVREIFDFPLAARIRRILAPSRESGALSNDDEKCAPAVVAECRIGRSETLRTACKGKSPAESGAVLRTRSVLMGRTRRLRLVDAVSTSDTSSDTEPGSRSKDA